MDAPTLTDQEFERSFGIFKGPPRYTAEILFTDIAAELVKNQVWHKDQEMEETEQGTLLRIPVHDDREIMMKILQYGAQAKVLEPEYLYKRIKEEVRQMLYAFDQIVSG